MVHFIILAAFVLIAPWHYIKDCITYGTICAGWIMAYYLAVKGAEWLVSKGLPDGAFKSMLLKKRGRHQ